MKTKLQLIALSLFGGVFLWTSAVFAIGQMSQPIRISLALRGQEITATLTLFNSEKTSQTFGLLDDGQIDGWAKFYLPENLEQPITEIEIPANGERLATVIFTVPTDTPNGLYEGAVAIAGAPSKAGTDGSSVGVQQRIDRQVSINVTDQEVIKVAASVIPRSYEVDPNGNLEIKMQYRNEGNIAVQPQVQIKVTTIDGSQTVGNTIVPYPEDETAVKPGQDKTISVIWPIGAIAEGRYRATVTTLVNSKAADEDSFRFTVGKGGLIAGAMLESSTAVIVGATVVGAILIALALFSLNFVIQKRKRNRVGNDA